MDSALNAVLRHLERDDETIDGNLVKEVVPMVILEVAAVPRCVQDRCDDWQFSCPETIEYQPTKKPGMWMVVDPKRHDFEMVPEESLKRMRARFLLMNGWYYRHYYELPYPMQQAVAYQFLRHSFGVPPHPDTNAGQIMKALLGAVCGKGKEADYAKEN